MFRVSLLAVFTAFGSALAAPALAHFDATDQYTHRECPVTAGNRVDPVNVVFATWGTWGRAVSQIEAHTGWTETSGSTQSFVDHGNCFEMHAQRASGHGSRFHVRIRGQHRIPCSAGPRSRARITRTS